MSKRASKVDKALKSGKYRIRVSLDHDWIEDGSDGKPLPESEEHYRDNPITPGGGPALSYADYLETYGNPDLYTGYNVDLEEQCACCGEWRRIESISTSLYDEYVEEGTYTIEQAPSYFAELAREMMP